MLDFLMPQLPKHKPNHLLGIADVESITRAVPLGIDTFDSWYIYGVDSFVYCV